MAEVKKVRTACRNCHGGCGVIAHVKDGKVIKVEGDPDSLLSPPFTQADFSSLSERLHRGLRI